MGFKEKKSCRRASERKRIWGFMLMLTGCAVVQIPSMLQNGEKIGGTEINVISQYSIEFPGMIGECSFK